MSKNEHNIGCGSFCSLGCSDFVMEVGTFSQGWTGMGMNLVGWYRDGDKISGDGCRSGLNRQEMRRMESPHCPSAGLLLATEPLLNCISPVYNNNVTK